MTLCDITTVSTFLQAKNWQNIVNTAFPHYLCTSTSHSSWCAINLLPTGVKETLNIPVHPKGDQSWVFIGSTDVEAESPILWPPDVKSWLIWKDPDGGKDRKWEKGTTEDEMVGWHHRLNGHGFGWTLGVGDGQGGLVCCASWGHKESDMTEQLNWTELTKLS